MNEIEKKTEIVKLVKKFKLEEFVLKLTNINTLSRLRFADIELIDSNKIVVTYYGHEVGGSYTYDYEVAPRYVKDIQYSTNCHTNWVGRRSGGFGCDIYIFHVFYKNTINKYPYQPVGKILRVDDETLFQERDGGIEWALVYMLYRELLKSPGKFSTINTSVQLEDGYKCIYNNGIKIAIVVDYKPEEYHDRGRWMHAIFDVVIKNVKYEILEIYKKYIQQEFNLVAYLDLIHTENHGKCLQIAFENGFEKVLTNWYFLYEDFLQEYQMYEQNRIFIELPSGKNVELYTGAELYYRHYCHLASPKYSFNDICRCIVKNYHGEFEPKDILFLVSLIDTHYPAIKDRLFGRNMFSVHSMY